MAAFTRDEALFLLHAVTTSRFRRNLKRIPADRTGKLKIESYTEVVGVASRASPHLLYAATVTQRVLQ